MRFKNTPALILLFQLILNPLVPLAARADTKAVGEAGVGAYGPAQGSGDAAEKTGLSFRLSEGAEAAERPEARPPAAQASKLSEAETARVLARLPELKRGEGDAQEFALRERSLPAPRAGATVLKPFPAPETRAAPDVVAGAATVLRHSPEGEVPLAPQVSLTFSRPVAAVTSQDEAARNVPAQMSPQPAGRWRWLGTKTLIFDPEGGRLPMATEYTVTVPGGAGLAPATWKFATPAPKLVRKYPEGGPARRDTVVFMEFDQKVEPGAVLGTVKLQAGAGAPLQVRLATEDEIRRDETVKRLVASATAGRWLALRATGALPGDSPVSVTVGPGTPSAEGPRRTAAAQSFAFRTYGPLRVTQHRCGYQKTCTPYDQWSVTFSNTLDREAFDPAQVKIEPAVEGLNIMAVGANLYIQGQKPGRRTYRVTLDASLRDEFGQTLGAPVVLDFNVGPAPPGLFSTGSGFVVLDPAGGPNFSVYSVNQPALKVNLYAVTPEDYGTYRAHMRGAAGYYDEKAKRQQPGPPGRLVSTKTVEVKGRPDETAETRLDLSPALKGGRGNVFVVVEPTVYAEPQNRRRGTQAVRAWVQVTGIGLDAFADREELVGWASSLADGRPLEGVEMSLGASGRKATTGRDGVARLPFEASSSGVLLARRGDETAFLPEHSDWWNNSTSWTRQAFADELRWFVFDDRKMYRPGEEVSLKGWLRRVGSGKAGDVGAPPGAVETVGYTLRDSRNNEILKGTARVNALGGFDTKFKLPGTMNLGGASLSFQAAGWTAGHPGRDHFHQIQVQEFRRPEFEVSAKVAGGPHFVGGHAQATVQANYFAGGGLPDSEVNWRVTAAPAVYTPPNRGDYVFGRWTPWWESYGSFHGTAGRENAQTFQGRTDASGKHTLRIDFDSANPPQPSNVSAQATVMDVNRQAWTSDTTMLVHPSDLYVGLRSERLFVQQGQPLVVETIVSDLDGRLVAGREVRMRAALLEWKYLKGQWQLSLSKEPEECTVKSGSEAVRCTFRPKAGGTYRVTARVYDDRERPNESELTLWVAGGKTPPRREVSQERVELIPDRKEYRPGDVAEILVQAPFTPAEGIMTLRRSGLVRTERFSMDGPSHTLRVPVEEGFTPNVYVQVDLVGAAARAGADGQADEKLPKRPAFASGSTNLSVPPLARKLLVTAMPRDRTLEPGGETTVVVEVKDAAGRPVAGGELAVVVVDESVLSLTGYKVADPLAVFYAQRGADVADYHLRKDILLADPGKLQLMQDGSGAGRAGMAQESVSVVSADNTSVQTRQVSNLPAAAPSARRDAGTLGKLQSEESEPQAAIRMRENFNALAVFAPSLPTDAQGRAEVRVKVPDNLTRYRVTAVSVAGGKQFGSGESSITARQPLMVRASAPRFLNFGDRFELPVVLQNQTDAAVEVDVAVRAANAELTDGAGRRVRVPANDRVEVRFPVSASAAGTARFQVGAVSGRHTDASQFELPVWTPATTEAFATYGELDQGGTVVQPVKAPPDVFRQFGGLDVQTSSTQLQALTDAVLYLVAYPYECSEQLASRVLAVAALRDVLTAFKAKDMPSPEEMERAVARDIKRLQGLQNGDGGFAFWRRGDESWPYVSIHVAHALARAKSKGYDVPSPMLDRSRDYLRNVESRIPRRYGRDARNSLVAYALYTRALSGDRDPARARRLIAENGLDKLQLEAVGWLLTVLSGDRASAAEVAAIRRLLDNRAE
ncbi:MAG TPA: DUF6049 family protein, partial [Pyrinomonadaceae bacterium]